MALFNTLKQILTPYANKINSHTEEIGELKKLESVKNDLYSEIPVTTQSGYYTKDGKIAVASADKMEVSTSYFNVTPNEEIIFVIENDNANDAWVAVGLCAIDGSWINRDIIATGKNVSGEYRYVIPEGVYLLAYSYRTYDGDVTVLAKRNVVEALKKEVSFVEYRFDYGDGYFGKSGEITAQTSTKEKYTEDYIPVVGDETLTVTIKLKTSKDQWARWIFYDSDKEFISYDNTTKLASDSMSISINVPVKASYMRISFRTYDIFNGLVINRNEGAFEAIKNYGNAIDESIIKHNKNCIFVSHRGYDPASTGTEGGNNKLESYYAASLHGFDAVETDVRFTSDLIPVCCHDASFVDATSGETVTIANNTFAELQLHDYYGSKIASFEDVLKACKNTGMMLFIDKLNTATTSEMGIVIDIVKQYGMQDKVCWIFAPSADTNVQMVLNSMPNTGIEVLSTDANVSANTLVTYGNGIASNLNAVYVAVNFTRTTPEEIKQLALTLDNRVKMAVWTLTAYIPRYLEYMPYVEAITTSGVSYNDICKRYGF